MARAVTAKTKPFLLRPFGPADFESLYEIDQLCYEPEVAYSRRELTTYLRYPGSQCVVAEARSAGAGSKSRTAAKIIGFCIIAVERDYAYIITIDVLEPWRRRGVGQSLLRECEKHAASRSATHIGLDTATDNVSAIAFWEKHGYRKVAVRKLYYPNGRDAFAMAKAIA